MYSLINIFASNLCSSEILSDLGSVKVRSFLKTLLSNWNTRTLNLFFISFKSDSNQTVFNQVR